MNITRRRFLQGLFAVPVLAAPLLVPERLYPEVVWVMPGRSETWSAPPDEKLIWTIVDMGASSRPGGRLP